jgi:hypothetical protein
VNSSLRYFPWSLRLGTVGTDGRCLAARREGPRILELRVLERRRDERRAGERPIAGRTRSRRHVCVRPRRLNDAQGRASGQFLRTPNESVRSCTTCWHQAGYCRIPARPLACYRVGSRRIGVRRPWPIQAAGGVRHHEPASPHLRPGYQCFARRPGGDRQVRGAPGRAASRCHYRA